MPSLPNDSPIAARLVQARAEAAMSTRTVAAMMEQAGVRISHATVANYERGDSVPSGETLRHFAAIYSRGLEWFLEPGFPPVGIRFRKTASRVKVAEEKQYVATACRWLEAYRRLERRVGKPLRGDRVGYRSLSGWTGQKLADHVRQAFLGLDEEDAVPSVVGVLESTFGIRAIEQYTLSRIDAFAAGFGEEHAVVLNPRASNDRARFNAGHELGHILFSDCDPALSLPHKEIEERSHDFAFYLLMPQPVLEEAFRGRSMVKLVKYKEAYGVSLAAMVYRAEKSGTLSKKDAEWLWRQFAIRGWRQAEPGTVRADRAVRFESLFEEETSRQTGTISRAEALRVMSVTEAEMESRLRLAAGVTAQVDEVDNHEDCQIEDQKGGDNPGILKFPQ